MIEGFVALGVDSNSASRLPLLKTGADENTILILIRFCPKQLTGISLPQPTESGGGHIP